MQVRQNQTESDDLFLCQFRCQICFHIMHHDDKENSTEIRYCIYSLNFFDNQLLQHLCFMFHILLIIFIKKDAVKFINFFVTQ